MFKIRIFFCMIYDRNIIEVLRASPTPLGRVRMAREILTNSYSYNQTQGFIGNTNFPMTNKKLHFFFALRSVCTNSRFAQVRLRLGKKNKSFFDFCFVFLSPCTNFAVAKDEVQWKRAAMWVHLQRVQLVKKCLKRRTSVSVRWFFVSALQGSPMPWMMRIFSSCTQASPSTPLRSLDAVLSTKTMGWIHN